MYIRDLDGFLIAAAGFFTGTLFGPLEGIAVALLIFMIFDYMSGMAAAWKEKMLDSRRGMQGLMKKVGILLLVSMGHILDSLIFTEGTAAFRTMVIFFFLSNEALSILENLGRLGLPIPKKLIEAVESLKERGE